MPDRCIVTGREGGKDGGRGRRCVIHIRLFIAHLQDFLLQALEDDVYAQFPTLSDAEVKAKSIVSIKKDDPKAVRDVAERINDCEKSLVELKEKVKDRKQNLLRAQEHLTLYRAQLEPVERVFSQLEDAVMDVPVSKDELGKVEVSILPSRVF